MNKDTLFETAGFIKEYRSEFEEFYRPFFENENALLEFFYEVFRNDDTDKRPRWMMNDILRFVSLSDDIDTIRPKRDPLRILFIRICMESLCKDAGSKTKDFYTSFDSCFSKVGKQYILSNFIFNGIDVPDELGGMDRALYETHIEYKLTISDFLRIIKATRDMVAHDGDYWSMQFFAHDTDSTWFTNITTDEQIIECQPKGKGITYCFKTTMQYNSFRLHFVKACITYIMKYLEEKKALHGFSDK